MAQGILHTESSHSGAQPTAIFFIFFRFCYIFYIVKAINIRQKSPYHLWNKNVIREKTSPEESLQILERKTGEPFSVPSWARFSERFHFLYLLVFFRFFSIVLHINKKKSNWNQINIEVSQNRMKSSNSNKSKWIPFEKWIQEPTTWAHQEINDRRRKKETKQN